VIHKWTLDLTDIRSLLIHGLWPSNKKCPGFLLLPFLGRGRDIYSLYSHRITYTHTIHIHHPRAFPCPLPLCLPLPPISH
jgi:hypothetical protein